MPARLHAFDDERIDALLGEPAGERQRRCEGDDTGAGLLQCLDGPLGRQPAGQHHKTDAALDAGRDERIERRVHDDDIDPERLVAALIDAVDLCRELIRGQRAAGHHAETAGVGDGGHQVPFGDPRHRAAHDRVAGAEERPPPRPVGIEPP